MISDELKEYLLKNSFAAPIPSNSFFCLIPEKFLPEITEWFNYYEQFSFGFDNHLVSKVITCETRYFELDIFKRAYFKTKGIVSNNCVMVELIVADTDFSIDTYRSMFQKMEVRTGRIYLSLYDGFKRLKSFIFYPK